MWRFRSSDIDPGRPARPRPHAAEVMKSVDAPDDATVRFTLNVC